MRLNPIFERELSVQSRSYVLPLIVVILNAILFLAGLLGIFGVITRMQLSAEHDYGAFLGIYAMVALLSFGLLVLITPSLSAGALSGERQAGTLDLLLTTQMSPAQIVTGKLASSAWMLAVLICSALPALLVPPVFGGVSMSRTLLLLAVFFGEAVYLLSVGIFASSFGRSQMRSGALAYGMTAALCIGTLLLAVLLRPLSGEGKNGAAYLLVLNPFATMGAMLAQILGEGRLLLAAFRDLNLLADSAFLRFFVPLSLLFQLAFSFLLILTAVVNITPVRGAVKRRESRNVGEAKAEGVNRPT